MSRAAELYRAHLAKLVAAQNLAEITAVRAETTGVHYQTRVVPFWWGKREGRWYLSGTIKAHVQALLSLLVFGRTLLLTLPFQWP